MSNPMTSPHAIGGNILQQAEIISKALRELQPTLRQQKDQLITILYPDIMASIASGVTQKQIRAQLATYGIKLHPTRFKQIMSAAAQTQTGCDAPVSDGEQTQPNQRGVE